MYHQDFFSSVFLADIVSAVQRENYKEVEICIRKFPSGIDQRDPKGRTVMHYAVLTANSNLLRLILEVIGKKPLIHVQDSNKKPLCFLLKKLVVTIWWKC